MKEREYLEDYTVGEKLISPGRTITEADFVLFAMLTGDWHPLHINKEYAKTTIFGERIAHGALTLTIGGALCMWMGPNTYSPKSFIANLGQDNVQLSKPLMIGDTIHWEGTVSHLEPKSKGRGLLQFHCEVKNQKDEVLASWDHKMLVMQRPE